MAATTRAPEIRNRHVSKYDAKHQRKEDKLFDETTNSDKVCDVRPDNKRHYKVQNVYPIPPTKATPLITRITTKRLLALSLTKGILDIDSQHYR